MTDDYGFDEFADDELAARLAQHGHPNPAWVVGRRDDPEVARTIARWLGWL